MSGLNKGFRTGSSAKRSISQDEKRKIGKDSMKNLLKYAIPYWPWFLLALLLVTIITATELLRPYLLGLAIDDISKAIRNPDAVTSYKEHIISLGVIFISVAFLQFIIAYFNTIILNITSAKIIKALRSKVFTHVMSLPFRYFDKTPIGSVVTRICNDTNAINEMYVNVLVNFFRDIFMMIGVIITMFVLDVKMTLVVLSVVPLMAFAAILFRKKARKIHTSIRARLSALNIFLSEHISGMKIVQLFNMQKVKQSEFDEINLQYKNENKSRIKIWGIFRPFMDVVSALALALIMWVGGNDVLTSTISIGVVYMFINYSRKFFHPIMSLTEMYNTTQASLVSSERIEVLLNTLSEEKPVTVKSLHDSKWKIEFKNVWFAYDDENWILKDVSFSVSPGEKVAIVGTTGAGKTTIISLILGFYRHQKGDILIDGISINDIDLQELRKQIGTVRQDVFLFKGDIETNIKLYNDIPIEDVIKAANTVNASKFINQLEDKYKENVNHRGTTFSEGQRQLLSFARALVNNPKILLLDEATSSVDTKTELLIQEGMEHMMKGRTSITVAHRLSTIVNSDEILFIHKGHIKEQGTHKELLKKKGYYYDLYTIQYS
ncbi:MAG: ABC transporter ATP-binding protein [Clostridiales bacterium]|nr:ABC transporter ATP-binding protein [Clostridiales bacterium]